LARLNERSSREAAAQLERQFDDVDVDVVTHLDDRSVRQATQMLELQFDEAGRRSVDAFSRSFDGRWRDTHSRFISDNNLMVESAHNTSTAFGNLGNSSAALTTQLTGLGGVIGALGRIGTPIAIVGMGAALVEVAGVAASAAQSLALLPGVLGAAGAAFGTLKLGMLGFGDALDSISDPEKFAEALRELAPNAQQAALAIQSLMPSFDQLRNATQNALFAGVGPQLDQLVSQYLPTIQSMTTSIASSFNEMFMGVTDQLMTPETQSAMAELANNVAGAFRELAPAVTPLTEAFADIMSVGSGFLPELAAAATDAAESFAKFISEARQSGDLQKFMGEGLDTLKLLGEGAKELVEAFFKLAPIGQEVLPDIVEMLGLVNDVMPLIGGAALLIGPSFGVWATALGPVSTLIDGIGTAFEALPGIVTVVGNTIITMANHIGNALDAAMGPFINWDDYPLLSVPGANGPGGPLSQSAIDKIHGTERGGIGQTFVPHSVASRDYPLPGQDPWDQFTIARIGDGSGWTSQPLLGGRSTGTGAGGPRLPDAPVLPYGTQLPPGIPGMPQTAATFGAESSYLDAQHNLAEKQARLTQLQQSGVATAEDVLKARNDVANAERDFQAAEMRLQESRQNQYEQMVKANDRLTKQMGDATNALGQIGATLDQDFGISKGLAGIAENITKFIANLAAAPLLGAMKGQQAALGFPDGAAGTGLVGALASSGAFGPNFVPTSTFATMVGGPSVSSLGPAALMPGGGGGIPYGLPAGSDVSGAAGFPPWVQQIAQAFGLTPSTYAGHQESNRQEAGFAPNPQNLNRGIDWSGPPENMQAFADYLKTVPGMEQVIWQNPNTGQRVGIAGGRDVTNSGYYAGDYGGHTDHVHTRQSSSIPLPGMPGVPGGSRTMPGQSWSADWNAIAQSESGGNWSIDTGNGYSGGLQFSPSSWVAAGGTQYAPSANLASPYQQALAAENLLALQGPGAWPNTFVPGSSGPLPPGLPQGGRGVTGGPGQSFGFPGAPQAPSWPGGQGGGDWFSGPGGPPTGPTVLGGINPPRGVGSGFGGFSGGIIGGLFSAGMAAAQSAISGATAAGQAGAAAAGAGGDAASSGASGGGGAAGGQAGAAGIAAGGAAASAVLETATKLINRGIGYGGQVVGIGANALQEALLPAGASELAGNNWAIRIGGAIIGATPMLPNLAGLGGQQPPEGLTPEQAAQFKAGQGRTPEDVASAGRGGVGQSAGQSINSNNRTTNITQNITNQNATEDLLGRDLAWHGQQAAAPRGRP
jgi:hypothetical protein